MAYQIDRYNNTVLTIVEDGTIDSTATDIKFIGKNYAGYGETVNENFLFLLENFAGANPPPRALSGQVWFDSANSKLKFYDGTQWRTTGGSEVAASEPGGLSIGDFWWDTANDQLYVFNGAIFILIGPQAAGTGVTQLVSENVLDDVGNTKTVIRATLDDQSVYVISNNASFTLGISFANTGPYTGFTYIRQGLTLKDSATGVTSTDYRWWGTASNADRLGGFTANDFVQAGGNNVFGDAGITIGDSLPFRLYVENSSDAVIENQLGSSNVIRFKARDAGGTATTSVEIRSSGLLPGSDNTYNLGTASLKWDTVYATTLSGTATQANALRVDGASYRSAAVASTANTIAARDASGNLTANLFQGIATQARYADLAEKYTTGDDLAPGTAVAVCAHSDHEVGPASASDFCVGVVSTDPAYMMNSEADGQYIGLKGRLPVRVKGAVKKGQAVYAMSDGVSTTLATKALVGIALETNLDDGEKLVECVLKV